MTETEARAYLAAFIDGEGHIGCHITARRRSTKTIEFSNTDKDLFDSVVAIGAVAGLRFRVYHQKSKREGWADKYTAYLAGGRSSFELFRDIIPLQSQRKKLALEELIQSYVPGERLEQIYASRRTSQLVSCAGCPKEFYAFPADLKRGQGKYCSVECCRKAKSTKSQIICQICKDPFVVTRHRTITARFCSRRCSGIAKSDRLRLQSKRAANARWHPRAA